jgi:hypothetical protein
MSNTLDWMEGLVELINAFYQATGDHQRVETYGHGIGELTPIVGSNLPHIFRPSEESDE